MSKIAISCCSGGVDTAGGYDDEAAPSSPSHLSTLATTERHAIGTQNDQNEHWDCGIFVQLEQGHSEAFHNTNKRRSRLRQAVSCQHDCFE